MPYRRALPRLLCVLSLLLAVTPGCVGDMVVVHPDGSLATPVAWETPEGIDGILTEPSVGPRQMLESLDQAYDEMSLPLALLLCASENPVIRGWQARILEAQARALQAGIPDTPRLDFLMADIPLEEHNGLRDADVQVTLRQRFAFSGRLAAERRLARTRQTELEARIRDEARNVRLEVELAFVDFWVASKAYWTGPIVKEPEGLALDLLAVRQRQEEIVTAEVTQGTRPEADRWKAQDAWAQAELDALAARETLESARARLQEAIGSRDLVMGRPAHELPAALQGIEDLAPNTWVLTHPRTEAAAKAVERARAGFDAETAAREDDFEAWIGYAFEGPEEDHWLRVGLSIPLPLWDRAEGSGWAARAGEAAAEADWGRVVMGLLAEFHTTREAYAVARKRLQVMEEVTVPNARAAYDLAANQENRTVSEFAILDARAAYLDAQLAFWQACGAVARTTYRMRALLGE